MSRIGLGNFVFGFFVLFAAAAAGSFLSILVTTGFLHDHAILTSWQLELLRSSHAHTNLFALIHICFGLTLPYSLLSERCKAWQSIGLALGTLAMALGLFVRSYGGPKEGYDVAEIFMGICLTVALASILAHTWGLMLKFRQRQ